MVSPFLVILTSALKWNKFTLQNCPDGPQVRLVYRAFELKPPILRQLKKLPIHGVCIQFSVLYPTISVHIESLIQSSALFTLNRLLLSTWFVLTVLLSLVNMPWFPLQNFVKWASIFVFLGVSPTLGYKRLLHEIMYSAYWTIWIDYNYSSYSRRLHR